MDRHTACAKIANRTKLLTIVGTASSIQATGGNGELMTAMGGEGIAWSVHLLNNGPLTAHQKELNITAFRKQTGRDSPLESHKTFTFGSMAFGFISKKDRHNKMGARGIQNNFSW